MWTCVVTLFVNLTYPSITKNNGDKTPVVAVVWFDIRWGSEESRLCWYVIGYCKRRFIRTSHESHTRHLGLSETSQCQLLPQHSSHVQVM